MTAQIFKPLYLLGNFHAFLASVDFLKTSFFFKKKVLPKIKSNSLDHDQAR